MRIRIRAGQKHADPADPDPDPKPCFIINGCVINLIMEETQGCHLIYLYSDSVALLPPDNRQDKRYANWPTCDFEECH